MGRADSPLRDRLVLVVGARRSGTNWLQRVLASHPEVVGIPSETYLFSHGIAPLAERVQHAAPGLTRTGALYADPEEFADAARDLCDRILLGAAQRLDPEARLIVERTPWHAHHLELIAGIYPDAQVLHIIRDGRDVARSIVAQSWGPSTLAEAAREWRETVTAARAAGGPRYQELRYEQLLAETPREAARLLASLGLEASEATIAATLAEAEVPFNVDPGDPSVASGKWRSALSAAELAEVEHEAGPLLAELGYEASAEPTHPPVRRGAPRPLRAVRRLARLRPRSAGLRIPRRRPDRRRFSREVLRRMEAGQLILEQLLEELWAARMERIGPLLAANASVWVIRGESRTGGRGESGREALEAALLADDAPRGHMRRGDVHVSVPMCIAFASFEHGDATHHRAVAARIEGERVSELSYYLLDGDG